MNRYWPVIDNALRVAAVENRVSIKLLVSWWNHSAPSEDFFLRSIEALSDSYSGVDIHVVKYLYAPQHRSNVDLFGLFFFFPYAETFHCTINR